MEWGKNSVKVQGKEQQHKTTVTVVLGMEIFKYTANSPICEQYLNGSKNSPLLLWDGEVKRMQTNLTWGD